ncbi:MAG: hypothetical protein ACRDRH_23460 [Pseudonocardia sp.]
MTDQPYASTPAGAAAAPKDVQTAFRLWIADIVLGVVGSLLSLLIFDDLVAMAELPPGLTPEQAALAATVGAIFAAVITLVFLGLGLLFAFKMRAGRNWARITLTVLGAIAVLFSLLSFGNSLVVAAIGLIGILSVVISVIQILLIVAAIFFMFRPAAAQYFAAPRR